MGLSKAIIGGIILTIGAVIIIASFIIPNVPGAMDWYKSLPLGEQSLTLEVKAGLNTAGSITDFIIKPMFFGWMSLLFIIGAVVAIIGLVTFLKP